jgi:hypothetical protein
MERVDDFMEVVPAEDREATTPQLPKWEQCYYFINYSCCPCRIIPEKFTGVADAGLLVGTADLNEAIRLALASLSLLLHFTFPRQHFPGNISQTTFPRQHFPGNIFQTKFYILRRA